VKFTTRLAVLLSSVVVLFSMLGIRLWFLQVAEGAQAAEAVADQRWITYSTQAPRGDIRDRDGVLLASSRYVPAVVIDRHLVDAEQRDDVIQRLSALLDIPPAELDQQYEDAGINGRIEVATIDATKAYQISERLRDLPGARIEKVPERVYFSGESMAHVIGHLGLPTDADLDADPDLDPNVRIGQLGVERVYDAYLQGDPGSISFQAQHSEIVAEQPDIEPVPGDTLYLTLDSGLQAVLERALVDGIANANEVKADLRSRGQEGAKNDVVRAAAVVLDVRTGEVLAMASVPSFQPELFVSGIDVDTYQALRDAQAFLNLAVSGVYPPASTFKVVTYMAEQEYGIPFPSGIEGIDPDSRRVSCDGKLELPGLNDGSPQIFYDWYFTSGIDFGWSDEHAALQNSCNLYFYTVALGAWRNWQGTALENVIQDQARALGYGSVTGIDLTGEADGMVPDRSLYEGYKERMLEDDDAPQLLDAARLEAASPWFGGDLMNLAIGQGGMSATPLQVAVSYAALANGGQVWRPYVVDQIRDTDGSIMYTGEPHLINDAQLDPDNVEALLTDLNRVVTQGTARAAFESFGSSLGQVGGKTGTGQSVQSKDNHAWFVAVAPIDDPRYVVAVVLDEGGSGGAVAAPIARYVLQHLMGEELDPIVAGEMQD
jgi:penicillin-binding protein 2